MNWLRKASIPLAEVALNVAVNQKADAPPPIAADTLRKKAMGFSFQALLVLAVLLTGAGLARAQWTAPLHPPATAPSNCVLLTDGTVMCQAGETTNNLMRLTPDSSGSYVNGLWSTTNITSMPAAYQPRFFCSVVLADGRVIFTGGEYNPPTGPGEVWTNQGYIFDPTANAGMGQWTPLTPPDGGTGVWTNIGDAACVVLPNKKFLLANYNSLQIAELDPATLIYTDLNPTNKADNNNEEGWTLLPDGTILTVDTRNGTNSEIYNPDVPALGTTNNWTSAGSTGVMLEGNGTEMGPAVLRPDGTVIAFGATPNTAVYNYKATGNKWATGPTYPSPFTCGGVTYTNFGVADGPASILPNGNVLVGASPFLDAAGTMEVHCTNFYEFDGTNLNPAPGNPDASTIVSYGLRMLVLPSGDVLVTHGSGSEGLEFYNNGKPYDPSWQPTITSAPGTVGRAGTYTISGTQFNGLSAGAYYGDDSSFATNYPLVRIVNNASHNVVYARTHDHSTMGVATGTAIVSTHFDVPATIELGPSQLFVVANGIPSLPLAIDVGAPTIGKSFAPSSIPLGANSTLSFTIVNPNASGTGVTLSGIGFTDTLPSGLTEGAISGSCSGGTIAAGPPISLSGATLNAGDSCTFSIVVTGVAPGIMNNVTSNVASSQGPGNSAAATLDVLAPPVISKSFAVPSIPLGTNTSLSFTITNPNASGLTLTGIGFTDTLPSGLTATGVVGACAGGIIATGPPISLTGASLAGGASCTFSVTVTGTAAGIKNNTTGNVTSNEGGVGNQAFAALLVIAPPNITKAFTPGKFLPGGTTTVSFVITNPNSFIGLIGVAFTDSLPSGLVVASPSGLSSTCGGTATASAGSGAISLSGGSLTPSGSCTVAVTVTAPEGVYLNSVQVTSTNGGTGNTSSATVYVATPPNLRKVFGEVSIGALSSTTLSFTLMNPNHIVTLDGLTFSDTLPAGLVISTPSLVTGSCDGGVIIAPAGSNLITLGSASLAAQASCTFSVNVSSDGTVLGYVTNTTSTVTSTEALPGAAASAIVFIGDPFMVSYKTNLNVGESYIDIANTGASGAPLSGPGLGAAAGNICVNVYAFDPGEELISCCSCLVTPDQTVDLGANRDLMVKTLTGVGATTITVKLLSTLAGGDGTGTSCTNSAATVTGALLANGLSAWGTTLHATPTAGSYDTTETPFTGATLSAGELASIGGRCAGIIGNGSGFGVCNTCRTGALGGTKSPQ